MCPEVNKAPPGPLLDMVHNAECGATLFKPDDFVIEQAVWHAPLGVWAQEVGLC